MWIPYPWILFMENFHAKTSNQQISMPKYLLEHICAWVNVANFTFFDVLRAWAKRRGMPTFDIWSSLFHNTSVRYEQHEYDTSNTGMTRVRHKQHSATRVRQECDTNKTNMARLRHKRHDCDMSGTFWFW